MVQAATTLHYLNQSTTPTRLSSRPVLPTPLLSPPFAWQKAIRLLAGVNQRTTQGLIRVAFPRCQAEVLQFHAHDLRYCVLCTCGHQRVLTRFGGLVSMPKICVVGTGLAKLKQIEMIYAYTVCHRFLSYTCEDLEL
jgi:hypothetical protein